MNFTLTKVNKQLILLVSGVFLLGGSVYADVYKWKNTKGIMQYSDSPPSAITQKPSQRILLSILKTQDYCANVPTKAKSNVGKADILANFFSPVTSTVKAVSPSFSIGNWNTGQTATSTLTTNSRLTTTTSVASRVFGSFGFNTISPSTPFGVQRSSLGTFGFGGQTTAPTTTFLAATKPTTTITTAVPVVSATATSVSGTNFMPTIDLTKVPLSKSGAFNRVLTTMPLPSAGDGDGQFRTVCGTSHMNSDDPIVFPGVKGAAHHHTFFGNTGANYTATPEAIASSGNSTCSGGIANRSAYWIPTLVNTATKAPLVAHDMVVYYKTGYIVPKQYITVPPKGLRMIVGNSKLTTPTTADQPDSVSFRCFTNTATSPISTRHIPACGVGGALRADISFPQCWDGRNLDSPDHKSHMAFPSYNNTTANKCPASHPIAIPKITVLADYNVDSGSASTWRLISDNYSTSSPAGYSFHSDWMNGWDEAIMTKIVRNCLNAGKECNNNLGDGTGLDDEVAYR